MTSFFDAFDPSRNPAPPTTATAGPEGPEAKQTRDRFTGALDHAQRQLDSNRDADRDRDRDRDHDASSGIVGVVQQDVERITVTRARDRLRRSGHNQDLGVPTDTRDTPRAAIEVLPRAEDDRRPQAKDAPQRSRRGRTRPMDVPAPRRRRQTPVREIPLPPIPGSATVSRTPRQTLSYAVRSPAAGREEIAVTPRTAALAAPQAADTGADTGDGEVTQVFSREALDAAKKLPPVPAWAGATESTARATTTPASTTVRLNTQAQGEHPAPSAAPEQTTGAQAIVSGPLRAYAAAMPAALPAARMIDSIFGAANAAALAASEFATLPSDADAPTSTPSIGEPIAGGLELDPAALRQLGGAGVPAQSLPNPRGVNTGRPAVDLASEVAANDVGNVKTAAGRGGLQRAEVVIGAGDAKVGLAVTTVGPHVTVEAQVPSELMADAMRNQLDDLKAALERHDLELSDLSFGEAGDPPDRSDAQASQSGNADGTSSPEEPEPAANDSDSPGIRIVA